MRDFFKILRYIIPYKKKAAASISFNVFYAFFGLFSIAMIMPFLGILFENQPRVHEMPEFALSTSYFMDAMNYHLSQIIENHGERWALFFVCLVMVVSSLLKGTTRYFSLYFLAPVRNGIVCDIRNNMFCKVVDLPMSYHTEERKGDLISRMSNDMKEIEMSIITSFEAFFRDPLIILFHLVFLLIMSFKLTMVVFIVLPLSSFLIGRVAKKLRNPSRKGQQKVGLLTSVLEETLYGLRIIKAFNSEERIKKRFVSVNRFYTRIMVKIFRVRGLASPLSEFLGTLIVVMILIYGSFLVLQDGTNMQPQTLITYLAAFYMIITPAKHFSTVFFQIQKGLASIERYNEVMQADVAIKDKENCISKPSFDSGISYENISFRYDKEPVLKNINFSMKKGQSIALVGESGSGKSTLVDLLPRLIDYHEGEIILDGKSIKDYCIQDIRNLMGIVTQQSILFNDTIFNNIAFGQKHVRERDVIEASKIANAHEFIEHLPGGYHTNIGDMGNKLSGGQKQRITIARAILKNPPILILDEATSALDTQAEKQVQDAIGNLMKNRTSLIIAHRLSTIKDCDEILVMHKGAIVERGKHNELVALNGFYKHYVDLQKFS